MHAPGKSVINLVGRYFSADDIILDLDARDKLHALAEFSEWQLA